jgi:hypothetical protein
MVLQMNHFTLHLASTLHCCKPSSTLGMVFDPNSCPIFPLGVLIPYFVVPLLRPACGPADSGLVRGGSGDRLIARSPLKFLLAAARPREAARAISTLPPFQYSPCGWECQDSRHPRLLRLVDLRLLVPEATLVGRHTRVVPRFDKHTVTEIDIH